MAPITVIELRVITVTIEPLLPLLRLFQLVSPALPVGAYSYSQGLEWAVEDALITDEQTADQWIHGVLRHTLATLDGPVLVRLYRSWREGDAGALIFWNQFILSCRETRELQSEDQFMGQALSRILIDLEVDWPYGYNRSRVSFAMPYSLAAFKWEIAVGQMVAGYFWGWLENQVLAAMKLIPLGQRAGQRILFKLAQSIPVYVDQALKIDDSEIGGSMPMVAIASSRHETQYSRLFRS